ncbi:hypothetical protein Hanom_Chr15g01365631 [Helianthus anomalus]
MFDSKFEGFKKALDSDRCHFRYDDLIRPDHFRYNHHQVRLIRVVGAQLEP